MGMNAPLVLTSRPAIDAFRLCSKVDTLLVHATESVTIGFLTIALDDLFFLAIIVSSIH